MDAKIAGQGATTRKYENENEQIKAEAERAARDYNVINVHDDRSDLAKACLSVGWRWPLSPS